MRWGNSHFVQAAFGTSCLSAPMPTDAGPPTLSTSALFSTMLANAVSLAIFTAVPITTVMADSAPPATFAATLFPLVLTNPGTTTSCTKRSHFSHFFALVTFRLYLY